MKKYIILFSLLNLVYSPVFASETWFSCSKSVNLTRIAKSIGDKYGPLISSNARIGEYRSPYSAIAFRDGYCFYIPAETSYGIPSWGDSGSNGIYFTQHMGTVECYDSENEYDATAQITFVRGDRWFTDDDCGVISSEF